MDGVLSADERQLLKTERHRLNLSDEDARAIEAEVQTTSPRQTLRQTPPLQGGKLQTVTKQRLICTLGVVGLGSIVLGVWTTSQFVSNLADVNGRQVLLLAALPITVPSLLAPRPRQTHRGIWARRLKLLKGSLLIVRSMTRLNIKFSNGRPSGIFKAVYSNKLRLHLMRRSGTRPEMPPQNCPATLIGISGLIRFIMQRSEKLRR